MCVAMRARWGGVKRQTRSEEEKRLDGAEDGKRRRLEEDELKMDEVGAECSRGRGGGNLPSTRKTK